MNLVGLKHGNFKVNLKNMNVLEIRKENDWLELDFLYKNKIKQEKKSLPKKFKNYIEINKFLDRFGFVKIGQYYINLQNVCIIEKEVIPDSLTHIIVFFYFNNGPTLEIKVTKNDFAAVESHKMVF